MVMIQGESLGQRAGTLPRSCDEPVLLEAADDDTLLDRLRAGDDVAFRLLVDRHRPWLVRLCTRLLGQDAHAAEDAAQESLLKLHRTALRDGRPLRVRPWLTVVARNTCVDEQRRRRPDLPGELPERAAPGVDPFEVDVALAEAWSGLAGRHREVLYLREVLGFSYKEIAAVMGLTMPATETLVFRARGALRREYERSGGASFGCGVLGFHLARLGLGGRREAAATRNVTNAPLGDATFSGLAPRVGQFLTSLPGCGEQAVAKALSMAAGVAVAAAALIPGVGAFGEPPRAEAAGGASTMVVAGLSSGSSSASAHGVGNTEAPAKAATLKALLGNAVPDGWEPGQTRRDVTASGVPAPGATASDHDSARITPLRDAAVAARPADRPTLGRPGPTDAAPAPLRSVLTSRPQADRPERPAPLRALLGDPVPFLIDPLPVEALPPAPGNGDETLPSEPPGDPVPAGPAPEAPVADRPARPERGSRPEVREIVEEGKGGLAAGDGNVDGDDPTLLRRRHR